MDKLSDPQSTSVPSLVTRLAIKSTDRLQIAQASRVLALGLLGKISRSTDCSICAGTAIEKLQVAAHQARKLLSFNPTNRPHPKDSKMNKATIMLDRPTNELMATRLSDASVQDIQLELIRRRRSQAVDGQRIADVLLQHRDLWEAVIMERLAISHPGSLPTMGLMKLRDLPKGDWNADTLFILSRSKTDAEALIKIFKQRHWAGLIELHTNAEEIDNALGGAKPGQAIVSIWWE